MPSLGAVRRSSARNRIAVIDIGSNSIRLVVYDALSRAPVQLFNEKVLCGLGRGLGETGRLNPDGVKSAFAHLERFVALARAIGVKRLDALATAAVRDAANGRAFAAEVRRRCRIAVKVLSGHDEGRLSALGVIAGIPDAQGVMGDLGGGSVELVPVTGGKAGTGATLPIGPLRLSEFQGDERRLRSVLDRYMGAVDWLGKRKGETFYAVGGAWRALARIHMEQTQYPIHVIQGYMLARGDAEDFLGLMSGLSRRSLEKMTGVSRKRLEVVPMAALVLRRIFRAMEPSRVVFSAYGLREGHLYDLLSERRRREDPLLSACRAIARANRRFGIEGDEIYAWIAPLFGRGDPHGRLRRAAADLGDMAWHEHPDYRAEQAFRSVLYMPLVGLDHRERAFVALTLHARYGGAEGAVREIIRRLIDDETAEAARVTGLALRLAYTLSGGVPGLLSEATLAIEAGTAVLNVPGEGPLLTGETVERRLAALGRALGRDSRVRRMPSAAQSRRRARAG